MKRNTKIILILVLSFITLGILGVVFVREVYYAPTDEVLLPKEIENKFINKTSVLGTNIINTDAFVSRLTIPALSINAKIQNVGITSKGNMSTPNNFFDVGLYKYGPLPGEKGSAVIDGHVDNGFGFKAVFGNLKNIKVNDDIYVEAEKGKVVHFVVIYTAVYDYNATAKEVFAQNDGSYLKLITCSGTWVPDLHTHDKRLVVTAIKADI